MTVPNSGKRYLIPRTALPRASATVAVNRSYTANGLNQYTAAGAASFTYDPKGNLTSDGTNTYGYSSESLLTSAPGATLSYDPFLRLYQIAGSTTTRFAYDGINIIADYDGSGVLQHRYVFGPGIDQPLVEYAGSGTTGRTFLSADERGSIFARSGGTGALVTADTYDEYGIPGSGNAGLFQYTGQAWISQLGFYYYKARMYSPTLGRFMQTDPLGYGGDGPNLYAYVINDPINLNDPSGLRWRIACAGVEGFPVCGLYWDPDPPGSGTVADLSGGRGVNPGSPHEGNRPGPKQKVQPQKKLTQCQQSFLRDNLARRGLATSQLGAVTFVEGLDNQASMITSASYNSSGNHAVTQGNRIYVHPEDWARYTGFQTADPFEEIVHTAQFASEGSTFYDNYAASFAANFLLGDGRFGSYMNVVDEAFAKGAASQMNDEAKAFMCKKNG